MRIITDILYKLAVMSTLSGIKRRRGSAALPSWSCRRGRGGSHFQEIPAEDVDGEGGGRPSAAVGRGAKVTRLSLDGHEGQQRFRYWCIVKLIDSRYPRDMESRTA